jgi:hypothetical protein
MLTNVPIIAVFVAEVLKDAISVLALFVAVIILVRYARRMPPE